MSRVTAFEGAKLFISYPTQLVCHLAEFASERQIAITEAIREYLTAARTLGGAPLLVHERLAYLAHLKQLRLAAVVADALERSAEQLPPAPTATKPRVREYTPPEIAATLERIGASDSMVKASGVRFSPQIPLQELAHLERYARLQKSGLPEAARDRLEFWRTLGGISLQAQQRIRVFATTKGISMDSAVANLLTEYARQLDDPPPSLPLENGLQVLSMDGVLERVGETLVSAKRQAAKQHAKKAAKHR
jgi:hypothetical protein